jgi:two-component system response regulator MprA
MASQLLLVDTNDADRAALQRVLETAGYTVAVATSGVEALRLVRAEPPDLVIVRFGLMGQPGLEICRRLWAIDAALPIIPLLKGADDLPEEFLIQPIATEALLARIRQRLHRAAPNEPRLLQFADLRLDTAAREARRGGRLIRLTTTEFDLLWLFLQHPRQVLTRDLLYERVWGHDFEGQSKVLDVYIYYLRRKLEAGGEARLIHTVRGAGYILRDLA